ncbi:conjugative transfer protein MobI(A/C) [Vibrio parahaemolyticus]
MSTDKISKKADIDWDLLLDPKKEDERSALYIDDIEATSKDFVLEIQNAIEQEMKVLIVEAKTKADVHWRANRTAREEEDENNQWRFGTRARLNGRSLSAEWFLNRFVPDPKGGKSQVYSTYLKKGKGNQYDLSAFKKATDDEFKSIKMTEEYYVVLRQRSNLLMKIRRLLNDYEKLIDKRKVKL